MVFHRLCVQLSFTCCSCVGGSGVGDVGVVSVVKDVDDNAVFFVMVGKERRDGRFFVVACCVAILCYKN